jgi:uncharacterized membrane protein
VSLTAPAKRPTVLAVLLIVAGIIGFIAAFALTLDKLALLADPKASLSCNISVLVGCSKNLNSRQGELFGFPNPLLGIAGWTAAIAVGVGILAGGRFARWYWALFNLGVAGALALVIFLITQSIYVLDVLCPWCMLTWFVTIPTFWIVTLYNLKEGNIPVPASVRRIASAAYSWVPLITLACYAIVAVLAQIQMDWLHRLYV